MNGCEPNFAMNFEIKPFFEKILNITSKKISFAHQLSSIIGEWMLSRPTTLFADITSEYLNKILIKCGNNASAIDLSVQFRTWRDVRPGK